MLGGKASHRLGKTLLARGPAECHYGHNRQATGRSDMQNRRTIGLALAAALIMAAPSAVQAQDKVDLNIGAGTQGGSQYPITVAIGQVLEKMPQIDTSRCNRAAASATSSASKKASRRSRDLAVAEHGVTAGCGAKPFKTEDPQRGQPVHPASVQRRRGRGAGFADQDVQGFRRQEDQYRRPRAIRSARSASNSSTCGHRAARSISARCASARRSRRSRMAMTTG